MQSIERKFKDTEEQKDGGRVRMEKPFYSRSFSSRNSMEFTGSLALSHIEFSVPTSGHV